MSQSISLTGKTAIITGATGGIGWATALALAKNGTSLLLHGNSNRQKLEQLLMEVRNFGVSAESVLADFTTQQERDFFIREAFQKMQKINIAVFAAGTDLMSPELKKMTFSERLERLFQVDVEGTIESARFFAETLRKNKQSGVMILFGWDGVERGMSGDTALLYAAAKGAIHGAVRSLAKSYAPDVRVIGIAPGFIKTNWGEIASENVQTQFAAESLSGRWGTPEEIASLVRFLVSDEASYLNAEIITINGGKRAV